jgi:hypothetical protein
MAALVYQLLLLAEREGLPYQIFTLNANAMGTARSVLDEVFSMLLLRLEDLGQKELPEDGEGLGLQGFYDELMADLRRKRVLVDNEAADLSLEEASSTQRSVEGGLKPRLPGVEGGLGERKEFREARTERRTSKTPADRDVVEWIRAEIEAMHRLCPGQRVLLFIDDLDLLDQCGTDGHTECARPSQFLGMALANLCWLSSCGVLKAERPFNPERIRPESFAAASFLIQSALRSARAPADVMSFFRCP